MFLSAEIRWFWPQQPPKRLFDWFTNDSVHPCLAGGGPPAREDVYVVDGASDELGIKVRGQKGDFSRKPGQGPLLDDVQIKGLVAVVPHGISFDSLHGPIEIWCKWPYAKFNLDTKKLLPIRKARWLRKFDMQASVEIPLDPNEDPVKKSQALPTQGCNVELTDVTLPGGEQWWTFGFEAFGEVHSLENNLRGAITLLINRGLPDLCKSGWMLNYPQWINRHAPKSEADQK